MVDWGLIEIRVSRKNQWDDFNFIIWLFYGINTWMGYTVDLFKYSFFSKTLIRRNYREDKIKNWNIWVRMNDEKKLFNFVFFCQNQKANIIL
jgi:hypothetical protein